MRVLITGDTHGDFSRLITKSLYPDDIVIVAGDFGILDSSNETIKKLEELSVLPFTTCFIDGNHENFDLLNSMPEIKFYEGTARQLELNGVRYPIYHLKRGEVYNFNGFKVFTYGGAISYDKHLRTPGVNWWKEELPTTEELSHALDTVHNNPKVDCIVTHDCPTHICYKLYKRPQPNEVNYQLDKILDSFIDDQGSYMYDCWYFGHHHKDLKIDDRFNCIYTDIIRVH